MKEVNPLSNDCAFSFRFLRLIYCILFAKKPITTAGLNSYSKSMIPIQISNYLKLCGLRIAESSMWSWCAKRYWWRSPMMIVIGCLYRKKSLKYPFELYSWWITPSDDQWNRFNGNERPFERVPRLSEWFDESRWTASTMEYHHSLHEESTIHEEWIYEEGCHHMVGCHHHMDVTTWMKRGMWTTVSQQSVTPPSGKLTSSW